MNKPKEMQSGNTYWQTDIQTAKGSVRCVVYLYAGAVEKEISNPTSDFSMHQRIIGQEIPADLREKFLAALCAKDAASLFSQQWIEMLPTPMLKVDGPPTGKQQIKRFAECCDAWAWWHLG